MRRVVRNGVFLDQRPGGEPHREPVVVVMIGGGRELLAAHEPRGFTVAQLFGDPDHLQAQPPQSFDRGRIAGPPNHGIQSTVRLRDIS